MANKERKMKLTELFILIFIIILSFLDFFGVLPGDVDFTKKILSWVVLGYLLYNISLSRLFFGSRKKLLDISIISAYFLFMLNDLTGYMAAYSAEADFLAPLYTFVVANNIAIELRSFAAGGILLILISVFAAFFVDVKHPSLMSVIHEGGVAPTLKKKTERLIATFFVLASFFIIFFNLAMEWFVIAVDASLIVFAFIFYMLTLFRSHFRRMDVKSFVYKVGDVGEGFYEKFIGLFHSRKKIALGISGLLVLHLLTDIAVFVIPYIFGLKEILYFGGLGEGHIPLYTLLMKDLASSATIFHSFGAAWIYLLNILGLLFLLVLPAYIWHNSYSGKSFSMGKIPLSIFFASALAFIIAPVFRIKEMSLGSLVGVDITTSTLKTGLPVILITLGTIFLGFLIYAISCNNAVKKRLTALAAISSSLFFMLYVFYFFKSSANYYVSTIKTLLFTLGNYLIGFYFIIFLAVTVLFYIAGFILFIVETHREFGHRG